ncbi:MAG: flagellin lysine-N-methylase [Sporomusaceae bacterium]|nr:flagellin lysine-N-methylase [Sporomusaceae bacterium]
MSKILQVLQPEYVKKFSCACGECEDICCRGWKVSIDKTTFQLYRNVSEPKLKQIIKKAVNRNRSGAGELEYAKIRMNEKNECPLLDEEKLCSLQRAKGEKYLSLVCATYPRMYNVVDNRLEKSLTLSCPEAARFALLDPSLMVFELSAEDANARKQMQRALVTEEKNQEVKNLPEKYFSQIRTFVISLLQTRSYPLWQRLIILGLFSQHLKNLIEGNKSAEILPLIATYLEQLKTGVLKDSLERIPSDKVSVQVEVIRLIIENRGKFGNDVRFKECLDNALAGFNYSPELSRDEVTANYEASYKTYYQPLMKEYILENYLVNYVFSTLFPFTNKRDVFANYIILIIHYATIKMLCIGTAGFYKEKFNTGQIVTVIQTLTKIFTHDDKFIGIVIDFLKRDQLDNMAYMSVLIKN